MPNLKSYLYSLYVVKLKSSCLSFTWNLFYPCIILQNPPLVSWKILVHPMMQYFQIWHNALYNIKNHILQYLHWTNQGSFYELWTSQVHGARLKFSKILIFVWKFVFHHLQQMPSFIFLWQAHLFSSLKKCAVTHPPFFLNQSFFPKKKKLMFYGESGQFSS